MFKNRTEQLIQILCKYEGWRGREIEQEGEGERGREKEREREREREAGERKREREREDNPVQLIAYNHRP
ncbi:MAG: hypothetical protein MJE68_05900 [Proteobacteria bacterium]|nr:hypothetical protein [Pseudomonadota bacterium]